MRDIVEITLRKNEEDQLSPLFVYVTSLSLRCLY